MLRVVAERATKLILESTEEWRKRLFGHIGDGGSLQMLERICFLFSCSCSYVPV